MRQQIAYVEDDPVILANYTELLREEGFDVAPFSDKESALASFAEDLPDLVLLDVTLHGERDAGFHICGELRRLSSDLPVIFLTSHDAELDKISGLRLGADDYITKDASIDYIVVRIEALFRRLHAVRAALHDDQTSSDIVLADLRVDDAFSCIFWKEQKVELSLTHFWIVRELCAHPGEVKSHRELMKACSLVVENNTITAHVRAIRSAFIALDETFDSITTERGRGYRWVVY
jgi:two-component system OmpR family response regulator